MTRKRVVLSAAAVMMIAVTTVLLWPPLSKAQLEGGFPQVEKLPYSFSGSILVVVSPKNDNVWAYSKHFGSWQRQPVDVRPKQTLSPTIQGEVIVFQAGNKLHAFSGVKGIWDTLPLDGGTEPQISTTHDMVIAHVGNNVHAFSAATANWASLTVEMK